MAGIPLRILLFAEEPSQGTYLETVLGMGAPGMFQVCVCDGAPALPQESLEGSGYDLLLLALDIDAGMDADAALDLPHGSLRIPTIVVSPWLPSLPGMTRLIRKGVDDVLGLAELTPQRLAAAILKVMERRWRLAQPSLRGPHAAARPLAGLHGHGAGEPWADAAAPA